MGLTATIALVVIAFAQLVDASMKLRAMIQFERGRKARDAAMKEMLGVGMLVGQQKSPPAVQPAPSVN